MGSRFGEDIVYSACEGMALGQLIVAEECGSRLHCLGNQETERVLETKFYPMAHTHT